MMRLRIQMGRLVLDPFDAKGTRELYAVRYHPTVREFMSNSALIPYRSHVEWTRTNLIGSLQLYLWLVRPSDSGRAIGFTQLKLNEARDTAEIGVMFREPARHQVTAALSTAVTLTLAYTKLGCPWVTSYVIPAHQHAIDFNVAWGASIVDSDKPGMVQLKLHRDVCTSNENYRRVMSRLSDRLTIIDLDRVP